MNLTEFKTLKVPDMVKIPKKVTHNTYKVGEITSIDLPNKRVGVLINNRYSRQSMEDIEIYKEV